MNSRRPVGIVLLAAFFLAAPSSVRAETHHILRFYSPSGSPRELRTMAFSPDGTMLVVSTASDRVSFIRLADGEIVREFQSTPFAISYSQDGTRLFMISESKRTLLDARTGAAIPFEMNAHVLPGYLGISFEIRGGKILVKEILDGGPVQALEKVQAGDEVVGVGEGRGGKMTRVLGYALDRLLPLLQGEAGSFVRLQVISKGQSEPVVHTVRRQTAERMDGKLVFLAMNDAVVQERAVWCMSDNKHEFSNAGTGAIISAFKPIDLQDVGQVAVSPDGKLFAILATRRDRTADGIEIFWIASRERLAYAPFPGDSWHQVRFSADASKLLVGTRDTVQILDIETGKYEDALTLGWNSPDDEAARTVGTGAAVKRSVGKTSGIDINGSRKRSPLQLLECLAVSPHRVVATGDPFGVVRVWDMASGEKRREFATNQEEEIEDVEFSLDGKWLAFYVGGELHVVDVTDLTSKGSGDATANPKAALSPGDAPLTPTSKVFRTSNGAEIRVTFDRPTGESEFRKAILEFLKELADDE